MSEVFVRVAVRIRPLLPREKLHKHRECVQLVPQQQQVLFGSDRLFSFDHAFGPTAGQDHVYTSCVRPLVQYVLSGFSATVFCYGQTGSGKTYTLEGGGSEDEEGGIIDGVAQDLFLLLEEKKKDSDPLETTVWVSYMELYREELRDLLEQPMVKKEFHIRDDEKGNTVVMGAREMVVTSAEELLSIIQMGRTQRHIASTGMNERSSRSHTIITLKVAQFSENSSVKSVRSSKLCLVDLAGSERAGKTGNTGVRFKESVRINTGLLALSKVISALSDPARAQHSAHIPYRDAKITRLLRDALGGTAHTLMVVCVSPSHHSADETLGALQFASKARHVRNSPRATCMVVKSCSITRVAELEFEVQALRELLKEKDMDMQTERSGGQPGRLDSFRQYRLLTEDAAVLLAEVSDPSVGHSFSQRLQEWQERLAAVSDTHHICNIEDSEGDEDNSDGVSVLKLREELKRCKEELHQKDKLLEQKDEELRRVQNDAEKLLQESKSSLRAFEQERECNRIQMVQLVDLQVQNDRLCKDRLCKEVMDLQKATSGSAEEEVAPERPAKRPHSVPLIRPNTGEQPPRKIHSSPAVFSVERAMAAFKVRGKRLLAEFDEKSEVFCPFVNPQAQMKETSRNNEEEDDKNSVSDAAFRHSLSQTWTVWQENCKQRQTNAGTKENHARLQPSAAQRIIQDLSVNIRMKEELITELDKADTVIQAVDAVEDTESGIVGELSMQNQQMRTDMFRSLQLMKLQRDRLQADLWQQRPTKDRKYLSQSQVLESSWLEQREEAVLQSRAHLQELQEELRSREEVVLRREACLQQKNKLEVKMLRSSQVVSKDLLRVSMQLKSVEEQLQSGSSGGVTAEELQKEREEFIKRRDALEAQLRENRGLTAEEEYSLLQLEEAVEALDGALELKNRFIEDKQKLLIAEPVPVCDVIRKLRELPPPEASQLLANYFNKVVCLREKDRHLHLRCEELELHVGELEASLSDAESSLQRLALEADRRFTRKCKEYQRNIERLALKLQENKPDKQQQVTQDRLQHLEKELFFYKSYSRQLKQKLKTLGSGGRQPDHQQQEHKHVHNTPTQASTNNSDETHSHTHAANTHTEQRDQKPHKISLVKRNIQNTPCPSVSSDLQAHNTAAVEYSQVQIQPQDRNAAGPAEYGESLGMTPVRLCRRKLRQISVPDQQLSASATGRQQFNIDKSTESILEDSLELTRKPEY